MKHLTSAGSFLLILLSLPAQGQIEDTGAPWRIAPTDQPDQEQMEPLDLNSATLKDLLQIPVMTPALAHAILSFRQLIGSFHDLEQVQRIDGVNEEIYEQILPFIQVKHDQKSAAVRIITRYQQAYPYPEEVALTPYRMGLKLAALASEGLAAGLALEKDPGESQYWDHAALSLSSSLPSRWGEFVLGDYLAGYGCGLVIRTRRNYGLGRNPEANLRFSPQGLQAYTGWEENIALRGAGLTLRRAEIFFSGWASRRWRDAYMDSTGAISAWDMAGLHRISSEKSRQSACQEDVLGMHVELATFAGLVRFAATGYQAEWDNDVLVAGIPIRRARVGGGEVSVGRTKYSGQMEVAWDDNGNSSGMSIMRLNLPTLRLSHVLYRITKDYFSPLASSLDMDLGQVRNKQGIYSSLSASSPWGSVAGFVHLYRHLQRPDGQSWGGQDMSIGAHRDFADLARVSLASRWVQEDEAESLEKASRWRGSGALIVEPPNWVLKSGLQLCRAQSTTAWGEMLHLGVLRRWRIDQKSGMTGGFQTAIYNAENDGVRVYWSQSDLSGSWYAKPLWGKGQLMQLSLKARHLGWGRFELILFWDQPQIESSRDRERSIVCVYRFP